jgi:hypothetical protein
MTTLEQAREKVQQVLDEMSKRLDLELALDETATCSEPWCWIFFYNAHACIETRSFSHALAGTADCRRARHWTGPYGDYSASDR